MRSSIESRFGVVAALAVTAVLATGCGGDDDPEPAAAQGGTSTGTISIEKAASEPRSITCADIETETEAAGKAALAAAHALAGTVEIPDATRYQTTERLLFAMYDLCESVDDGTYRPAPDAIEAVESGKYQLGG